MDVLEELVRLRHLGQRCALATIVGSHGPIPSYEGAKLLVREDGTMVGTVGGGCIEAEVFSTAREVLHTGKPRRLAFDLAQEIAYDSGLVCGGQLEIFVEPIIPPPRAYIFGAGHISKSLSKVAGLAGFAPVVVDERESFARRDRFPEAEEVLAGEWEEVCAKLPVSETSFIVIVTRGHRDDLRVLRWAAGTPARYVAMIGSQRKVVALARQLEEEGVPRQALERIHAPMGLDIGAVTPEEIAVATVAEMIAVRRNAASGWRALSKTVFAREPGKAQTE